MLACRPDVVGPPDDDGRPSPEGSHHRADRADRAYDWTGQSCMNNTTVSDHREATTDNFILSVPTLTFALVDCRGSIPLVLMRHRESSYPQHGQYA